MFLLVFLTSPGSLLGQELPFFVFAPYLVKVDPSQICFFFLLCSCSDTAVQKAAEKTEEQSRRVENILFLGQDRLISYLS